MRDIFPNERDLPPIIRQNTRHHYRPFSAFRLPATNLRDYLIPSGPARRPGTGRPPPPARPGRGWVISIVVWIELLWGGLRRLQGRREGEREGGREMVQQGAKLMSSIKADDITIGPHTQAQCGICCNCLGCGISETRRPVVTGAPQTKFGLVFGCVGLEGIGPVEDMGSTSPGNMHHPGKASRVEIIFASRTKFEHPPRGGTLRAAPRGCGSRSAAPRLRQVCRE